MLKQTMATAVAALLLMSVSAHAEEIKISNDNHHHDHSQHHGEGPEAPISVMGDHIHDKGDWMLSYRYSYMDMHGSLNGDSDINPTTIATTLPNRFFGVPGQPATLRIVPTDMTMEMHMFGAMYAPADWLTLMVMGMWHEKEMDHLTFLGGAGTAIRGRFTTESKGWGDTSLTGLIRVYEKGNHRIHLNAGVSAPTGAIDKTATVLTPAGGTPRLRMPYAMQLGTGTWDVMPGVTYTGSKGQWGWGGQYRAEIRLEDENDEGYAWGDKHSLTAWGGYQWINGISAVLHATGSTQDSISGIDPQIVGPVQTADPDNYGGERLDLGLDLSYTVPRGDLKGQRIGIEGQIPVYQDLNGPQLETDWIVTVGLKYGF